MASLVFLRGHRHCEEWAVVVRFHAATLSSVVRRIASRRFLRLRAGVTCVTMNCTQGDRDGLVDRRRTSLHDVYVHALGGVYPQGTSRGQVRSSRRTQPLGRSSVASPPRRNSSNRDTGASPLSARSNAIAGVARSSPTGRSFGVGVAWTTRGAPPASLTRPLASDANLARWERRCLGCAEWTWSVWHT
jgi:hypothetical protein